MGAAADDERDLLRTEPLTTPALLDAATTVDEPPLRALTEDCDRYARRVNVLTTRVALMAERERRGRGHLAALELRVFQAEELAARRLEHIDALHRTLSWRVTAPLRRLRALRSG